MVGSFLLFLSFVGAFSAWKEIRIGLGLVRSNRQEQGARDNAARCNALQRQLATGMTRPNSALQWRQRARRDRLIT